MKMLKKNQLILLFLFGILISAITCNFPIKNEEELEVEVSTEAEFDEALQTENISSIIITSNLTLTTTKEITNKTLIINLKGNSLEISQNILYGFDLVNSEITIIADSDDSDMSIKGSKSSLFNLYLSKLVIKSQSSNYTLFLGDDSVLCLFYCEEESILELSGKMELASKTYSLLLYYSSTANINGEEKGMVIEKPMIGLYSSSFTIKGKITISKSINVYYYSSLIIDALAQEISIGDMEITYGVYITKSSTGSIQGNVKIYGYYDTVGVTENSTLTFSEGQIDIYGESTALYSSESNIIIEGNEDDSSINVGVNTENKYGLFVYSSNIDISGNVKIYGALQAVALNDDDSIINVKNEHISFINNGNNYVTHFVFDDEEENKGVVFGGDFSQDKCEADSLNLKSQNVADKKYKIYINKNYCEDKKEKIIGVNSSQTLVQNTYIYYNSNNEISIKIYNNYLVNNNYNITQISTGLVKNVYILSSISPSNFILYDTQIINLNFNGELVDGINSIYLQEQSDKTLEKTITDIAQNGTLYQITLDYENDKSLIGKFNIKFNFESAKNSVVLIKENNVLNINQLTLSQVNVIDNIVAKKEFNFDYSESTENILLLSKNTNINKIRLTFNEDNLIKGAFSITNTKGYLLDYYIEENYLYILSGSEASKIEANTEISVQFTNGKMTSTYKLQLVFFELTNISPSTHIFTSSQKNFTLTYDTKLTNIKNFEIINEKTKTTVKKISSFNYVASSNEHKYSFLINRSDNLYGNYLIKTVFDSTKNLDFTSDKYFRIDQILSISNLIINKKIYYNFYINQKKEFEVPYLEGKTISSIIFDFSSNVLANRFDISLDKNYTFQIEYNEDKNKEYVNINFDSEMIFNEESIKFTLVDTYTTNEKFTLEIKKLRLISIDPVKMEFKNDDDDKKLTLKYSTRLYNLKSLKLIKKDDEKKTYEYSSMKVQEIFSNNSYYYTCLISNDDNIEKGKYKIQTLFYYEDLDFTSSSDDLYLEIDVNKSVISKSLRVFIIIIVVFIIIFVIVSIVIIRSNKKKSEEAENIEKVSFVGKDSMGGQKMSFKSNFNLD